MVNDGQTGVLHFSMRVVVFQKCNFFLRTASRFGVVIYNLLWGQGQQAALNYRNICIAEVISRIEQLQDNLKPD